MTYDPTDGFDEAESPDDKELNHLIDEWLSRDRPERYDSSEKDWMEDAVEKAGDELTRRASDEVIRETARRRVYQREGLATKRANKILRDISDTGQLPMGWNDGQWRSYLFEILRMPLSVGEHKRIRFGAASPSDLEQWELENHREQEKRDDAQMRARKGARLIAELMRAQQAQRVEDLRVDGE